MSQENFFIQSLYVHFPFCEQRCHYCDFYALGKEKTTQQKIQQFEKALSQELSLQEHLLHPNLQSIFLGGGTPSIHSTEAMERLFEPLLEKKNIQNTEWTMEANPSSVVQQDLKRLLHLGINRISLGVQSTHAEHLHALGRVHTESDVYYALDKIFSSGFENVSVDIMCGIPNQTIDQLEATLNSLLHYPITHLSCYLLTLKPQHFLFTQLPSEAIQRAHYLFISQWMKAQGFEHYEVSNYARPGKESQHNLAYWKQQAFLGCGPSACSYYPKKQQRVKNIASLGKYCTTVFENQVPFYEVEYLTKDQQTLEHWMLQLRLESGIPIVSLEKAGKLAKIKWWIENGLAEKHPQHSSIRLTAEGFLIMDSLVLELI